LLSRIDFDASAAYWDCIILSIIIFTQHYHHQHTIGRDANKKFPMKMLKKKNPNCQSIQTQLMHAVIVSMT
jgi:hypothetical protein